MLPEWPTQRRNDKQAPVDVRIDAICLWKENQYGSAKIHRTYT